VRFNKDCFVKKEEIELWSELIFFKTTLDAILENKKEEVIFMLSIMENKLFIDEEDEFNDLQVTSKC